MKKHLTLIEVVIAIAILALSLVAAMSISSGSKQRIEKAYQRWKNQNMLSQAAEYYLLVGPDSDIPYNVFPHENVRATCSIQECNNLPDDVKINAGKWLLSTYHIEISSNGKILKSIDIDKIVNRNEI